MFSKGDAVFLRSEGGHEWVPAVVVACTGSQMYLCRTEEGVKLRRHVDDLRSATVQLTFQSLGQSRGKRRVVKLVSQSSSGTVRTWILGQVVHRDMEWSQRWSRILAELEC